MTQHPQFTYKTQRFTKSQYLQDTLGRLKDEVGTLLECIKTHNHEAVVKSERTIGYWAGIRLIMPVIESIAEAVGEKPWEFLENHLDISTPNLAWQMFRHSLLHGDLVRSLQYGTKRVRWGIILMGHGHIIKQGQIHLDVYSLYEKLIEYLEVEIAKNDQALIEVRIGIVYSNPEQYIIDDFDKMNYPAASRRGIKNLI